MNIEEMTRYPPELLAPNILVTKRQFKDTDPRALPDAVIAFCDWCIGEAGLPKNSVQPDAWLIYYTSLYLGQVNNGGHGQFAGNSDMDRAILAAVDAGLTALGLDDLRAIFSRFICVMAADKALHEQVVEAGGFGDVPTVITAFDESFFASPDRGHFAPRAADWLRRNRHLLALTPADKRAREKTIIANRMALIPALSPLTRVTAKVRGFWSKRTDRRRPITTRDDFETELARLQTAFDDAVADNDSEAAEAAIAGYRALHDAYRPDNRQRWSDELLRLGTKLLLAGERWGRADLLNQAADAIGRAIAEGADEGDGFNAAYTWRALGDALVGLARIDHVRIPVLAEALVAFDRAIAIDEAHSRGRTTRVTGESWIGKAEAMILLATTGDRAARLSAAGTLLNEAPALHTLAGPARTAAAHAELLIQLPERDVTEAAKRRARRMLDTAISVERENDGAIWSSPFRLRRLQQLRADARLATRGMSTGEIG